MLRLVALLALASWPSLVEGPPPAATWTASEAASGAPDRAPPAAGDVGALRVAPVSAPSAIRRSAPTEAPPEVAERASQRPIATPPGWRPITRLRSLDTGDD